MNKAFIKEREEDRDLLPDRPVPAGLNLVTTEGLAQIEEAIARLQTEQEAARSAGNVSEIAPLARDLRYWMARRATAQLAEPSGSSNVVEFGSTVTFRRVDGREQTFRIVGTDEADPAGGTLSHISPLAKALLGRAKGDTVGVGAGDAEIVAIR